MPKSQWGALRYFARTASGPDFVAALTDFLVEAQDGTQRAGRSVRKGEKRWGQPVLIEGQRQRLGEWLVRAVQRAAGGADVRLVTELLAVHAPRVQAATQREVQR